MRKFLEPPKNCVGISRALIMDAGQKSYFIERCTMTAKNLAMNHFPLLMNVRSLRAATVSY